LSWLGFVVFLWGLRPHGLATCPHGLCRGSASSAEPPQPWADGLRPFYPPTATRRPSGAGLCDFLNITHPCADGASLHCIRAPLLGVRAALCSATF